MEMLNVAFDQGYQCYKCFPDRRKGAENNGHPGHPIKSGSDNTEKVMKMIVFGHRITIREITDDVRISVGSYLAIVF